MDGINSATINNKCMYNSPSLICYKVTRVSQNAKTEIVKRSKAKVQMILKMTIEKEGIILNGANLEEVFPANR